MVAWLSSGLLLGWSLGANDVANVFGTAVASRMVRFATAAKFCAVFVILGGLVNGPAAMETVGALGQIETLPGAFATALAPAVIIAAMVRLGIPVSTSQAMVGALIGYRLMMVGSLDAATWRLLWTIILTWAACPVLAAIVAFCSYKLTALIFRSLPMPLFALDRWLRFGLIAAGCYGAWALGGNNLANVVGVYARLDLFAPVQFGPWALSQSRMLAILGGLAIALGAATYSYRVMLTVGRDLMRLDAFSAFIAVFAEALAVDFFAHSWKIGTFVLPAIPVSITQALIGAVLGIGFARGLHTMKMPVLGLIALGWVLTPLLAALLTAGILPLVLRLV
ncbi:MAG TPA: anion permease [Candidatus Methylomirabilis sp.]|nr:anion permease [Candidatus Methylomirabilis sp.]